MIRTRRMAVMTLAMVSVAVVDACRHKPPEVQPTVTVSSRDTAAERRQREADARRRQDSIDAANAARARARADSIAAARAAADRANAGMADVRNALTAVVHFDYDQADL